jgi:hypothetical protein
MKADILEMALRPGLRQQRTRGIDRHIGAHLRQQRVMNVAYRRADSVPQRSARPGDQAEA